MPFTWSIIARVLVDSTTATSCAVASSAVTSCFATAATGASPVADAEEKNVRVRLRATCNWSPSAIVEGGKESVTA